MRFDADGNAYLRQSWLDTFSDCPERARLDLIHPERITETDAANAGTGTHAAIEAFLSGEIALQDVGEYAFQAARQLCEENDIRYVKFDGPRELCDRAEAAAKAWVRDILPRLPLGGQAEVKFCAPLYRETVDWTHRPRTVFIEGTIDYVDDQLWDWKAPGREYKQYEKQDKSIQPTVYCAAAHILWGWEYPIRFNYGIMQHNKTIRDGVTAKGYTFPTQRVEGHQRWLEAVVRNVMTLVDSVGLERPWPLTGDQGYLCSSTWCDHWDHCRGKFLTMDQARWKP